jgi:hypothetical protein
MNFLSKRTWLGALLFLIFVGEPTVGFHSGLFTSPAGFIALAALYLILFLLYEAIIQKYKLSNARILLLTFGIYSIIVTGFLHGEIGDYGLHPHEAFGITLIRLQSSLFVPFAYYLLNKKFKRDPKRVLCVSKALLIAGIYVFILTPTHRFGLTKLYDTFSEAPLMALLYSATGMAAIFFALKPSKLGSVYRTKALTIWTWILFAIAIVPIPSFFLILVLTMPIVTIVYLRLPAWRNSPV